MILDKLFQLMAEKQASDIFVSAGVPIHIKICLLYTSPSPRD